jgi:hypothetical protein
MTAVRTSRSGSTAQRRAAGIENKRLFIGSTLLLIVFGIYYTE